VFDHASCIGDFDSVLATGLFDLEGDKGYLFGQLDTGALEHCSSEFIARLCTSNDDGGERWKVGTGACVGHFDDLAERFHAPEFSYFCEQGGGDAAIFGPETSAQGLLSDPEA